MKINGVLHVDQTPHQATLRLDKVVNNELVDDKVLDLIDVKQKSNDLKTRERVNLSLDKDIIINLRKLSKLNNVPMCRLVDKAILAMYQEDFKKFE